MASTNQTVKMVSFNCKSAARSVEGIREICKTAHVIALQETWLLPHDTAYIGSIDKNFDYTSKSAVDTSVGVLRGRPYGGVALMWKKDVFSSVAVLPCSSVRLAAIKVCVGERNSLVFSVYMPTDSADNLLEFTEVLSEINAVIESCDIESAIMLGDFNAHPNELFFRELSNFCTERSWLCADVIKLNTFTDTHTFVSESHNNCKRWLDHCLTTEAAWQCVADIKVLYDVYWSDHFPMVVYCNMGVLPRKKYCNGNLYNEVRWGERNAEQIRLYSELCNNELRDIDFPMELGSCADNVCSNKSHYAIIDELYNSIVSALTLAARSSNRLRKHQKQKYVIGWNTHVQRAHLEARSSFQTWLLYGKPKSGDIYNTMCESRRRFKSKLKWCQDNVERIKMDILATHHKEKDFKRFWKHTRKLETGLCVPACVEGRNEPQQIAELFRERFKVESPLPGVRQGGLDAEVEDGMRVRFTIKEVAQVINCMTRGKSPGHDDLSIEHLQHAGTHLPRVLVMFYNLCLGHSYLPQELMKTTVIPIIKNKTGDASDGNNYRPISLATVIAKVLDGLLDCHLSKHIQLHDAQFGFRAGLSTEAAILRLKHTIQYYVTRKTPIFGCFLDLSKAFDLVAYNVLWDKLREETSTPRDMINILRYWYGNQSNNVKWAGSYSTEYRLECGVRQGGLTSPRLFNLYVNGLIDELSRAGVGCSIDGNCTNNISYADDMALLSPSVKALNMLIGICERYAVTHGLRYNTKKSELLVFKAGNKTPTTIPPVKLGGIPVSRVTKFKYLGHWVTEDLSDDLDIERERRALAVRCNMLARRFARCTDDVKITLFKAYCQTMYTCSLWIRYTQKAFNALRVLYNNGFRMLMGLPRYCSASGMFAETNTDCCRAIVRKRIASLMCRVRGSPNGLLNTIIEKVECPIVRHWNRVHRSGAILFNIR